jgi:uncharacterized membrane protein
MDGFLFALTLAGALGSGLVAGVFFAFSSFVMPALARLPAAQGIAAMQAINVAAISFAFMLALFGTALLCLALVVWGIAEWGGSFGPYLVGGGALYLLGVVATTGAYNVPRNNALGELAASDPRAPGEWSRYRSEWTAGNHVRTVTALAAAGLLSAALSM